MPLFYMTIYHITTEQEWMNQSQQDVYYTPDFQSVGYIHACSQTQIEGVLTRYFFGKENLILLAVDENKLDHDVKYESAPNGDVFPHIYGGINKEAVMWTKKLK
jgi:uncharacterized protein (DUF952 family)